MKKSIFLFFAAILCAMTANAAYYYRGEKNASGGNWLDGIELTDADGYYAYFKTTGGAHQFKICTDKSDWNKTNYNYTYVKSGYHSTDITEIGDYGKNNCYTWTTKDHYIIVYYPNTAINSTNDPIICASTTLPWDGGCYLMGNGDWENGVEMQLNSKNNNEFILLDQQITEPIKFKYGNNKWTDAVENYGDNGASWEDGNLVLPAGNYDFYFKKDIQKVYIARNTVVTTTANPAESGTLTGAGVYNNNDDVTLTATANPGYKFVNWTKAGVEVSTNATYEFKAAGDVEYVANFVKTATVTVEDEFGTNTYTGVEENDGVWSKEYNVGDEVTLNIASLDPELVFAYWSVGAEKIFTEEYTFTATEDVTVTAVYALPMEVTFDNMTLDTESWIVEAGPDAEYGVTVILGIDVEGDHPKGFGLVDGSSISLGEDELELVTGYFTDVDQDAPSAEAVVIAVYAEELMAFVCTMSGVAAPAVPVEVLDGVATVDNATSELWITGQWEGDDVYVQVPGFDGASFDCPEIWFYVGGTDYETASIIARGPATITVEDGNVSVEGTVLAGATNTDYELRVIGTLPVAPATVTVTVEDVFDTNTYTGVEENDGVWSKEYNVGDEVTLAIASLDPELVFAYWSVGAEKIFTEEYTFTASEDVTVTAVYALPMEVTFDNMTLDTDSWIVEAGPDAEEYGVTLMLGIDVENQLSNGNFPLVDGSSISLGEDELEIVTGYFTAVDPDAPSAEAVIIAVYAEELMAFVCSMSGVAAPAVPVEVLDGVATPNNATGELWITGQWEGDDVYVQVPGFDGASFDCPEIWFYVGGTNFETASIIARGPATITVEDGDVSVEGTVLAGATNTDYELFVIGTLPVATPDYTRTVTAGNFGTICLPFGSTNYTGMELFECVGKEEGKVFIGSVTTLVAGTPYIFLATGTELAVYSDGTTAATPGDHNGLHGTFTNDTEVAVGNYILKDNALCQAATTCWVNANRAYLVMDEVPAGAPQQMPGRRYIGMSTKGENAATGLDNITNGENVVKTIVNGQLVITIDGVQYNAQGIKF